MNDQDFDQPQSKETIDAAVELLRARQSELFREKSTLHAQREALMRDLSVVEARMESLSHRIDAIREVLMVDLPTARQGVRISWQRFTLPEAAACLLEEVGGYLSESQIRAGLGEHGVSVDDTQTLADALRVAADDGAPLLRVSSDQWGHYAWVDQARYSLPHKFRKTTT